MSCNLHVALVCSLTARERKFSLVFVGSLPHPATAQPDDDDDDDDDDGWG